jgi:hypothetical protein
MAKRRKKKSVKRVSIPGSVRKAKNVIKKHSALKMKERKKAEAELSKINRELRELKSL